MQNRFVVERVQNLAAHYPPTLRAWGDKFAKNFDSSIGPSLEEQGADAQVFRKKWEYYFTYCEAGFEERCLACPMITVAREGTVGLAGAVSE